MCRLGTKEALIKAVDKHSTSLLMLSELRDLINDCEKYASLYKKMTTSVLAGCIQVKSGLFKNKSFQNQLVWVAWTRLIELGWFLGHMTLNRLL